MKTLAGLFAKPLTHAVAAVVAVASWSCSATAQQPAAQQVVTLPADMTMDSREHIFWDPAKGPDANPADCAAIGGVMQGATGSRRCFISIKVWISLAPGNVLGEFCVPGQGKALAALLNSENVQNLNARNLLVWTSADGKPFGYAQASKCNGK